MDIKQLVKEAQLGDKEALLSLIMAEQHNYYRLAYSYVGNREDAMDALEDMIVIVYEKIQQLNKHEAFYAWSKSILVNRCKAIIKSRNKHILIDEWQEVWGELLDKQSATFNKNRQQRMELEEQLKLLSEEQRETITLKYWHDLDNLSIAQMLNIPLGTVKSRLHQGLKKLRHFAGKE